MSEKRYVSYSKCYTSKSDSKRIPEYLVYALENRDKQMHINYQSSLKNQKSSPKEVV